MDLTNQTLGPYHINREIGRGGMAMIYHATVVADEPASLQLRIGDTVALKVLLEHYTHDPTTLRRFRQEGENAQRMLHPHIVRVFAAGHINGYHYIAMEYAAGGTLSDRLKARSIPMNAQDALTVLRLTASALDYAHSRGILHRDVKPSNILLGERGQVWLADFGVARHLSTDYTVVTVAGYAVGTPSYMSPEQARGDFDLTPAADIYSLGVVAYAVLTHRLPFEAESQIALLRKIIDDAPVPPDSYNHTISSGVSYAIQRALAKMPEQRYPTATAFVDALEQGLTWQPQPRDWAALTKTETESTSTSANAPNTRRPTASNLARPSRQRSKPRNTGPLISVLTLLTAGVIALLLIHSSGGMSERIHYFLPAALQLAMNTTPEKNHAANPLPPMSMPVSDIPTTTVVATLHSKLVVTQTSTTTQTVTGTAEPGSIATERQSAIVLSTPTATTPPLSTPLPSATPSVTLSPTATPQPTATATDDATATAQEQATTLAAFVAQTLTALPTPTRQSTATPSVTPIPTATPSNTATATEPPTSTPLPTRTLRPIATATPALLLTLTAIDTQLTALATYLAPPTSTPLPSPTATPEPTMTTLPTVTAAPTPITNNGESETTSTPALERSGQRRDTDSILDTSSLQGRIAYSLFNGRTMDIYVYNFADGNHWPHLPNRRQPDLNRGGAYLLANGEGGDVNDIVRINLSGGEQVTTVHPEDAFPQWSPSGQSLVYASTHQGDGKYRIYWQRDATDRTDSPALSYSGRELFGQYPVYLDNWRIAYQGCNVWAGGSACGIYTADTSGNEPNRATDQTADLPSDSFGNAILFSANRDGNWDIYRVNWDGSGLVRLTDHSARDGLATAAPDLQHIAFISDREGSWGLYVMNADGTGQQKLFDLHGSYGSGDYEWYRERLSWGP